jgi:hypothetical protein
MDEEMWGRLSSLPSQFQEDRAKPNRQHPKESRLESLPHNF